MAANTPWAMPCKLRRAAGRRLRSAAWGAGARPAPLRAAETWRGPRLDEVLAPHAGMRMPRPGERDASDPGRGTSGLPAGRLFEILVYEPHGGTWQGGELDVGDAVAGGHPPGRDVVHAVHDGAGGADVAGAGDDGEDELGVAVAAAGVVDEQA